MILNNESKIIHFSNTRISQEEAKKIYIPSKSLSMEKSLFLDSLVSINNKIYYKKYGDIINELIGSFLAKKIDLNSVDYLVGEYNNELYLLSELFYNKNFEYFYPKDYPKFKMNSSKKIKSNPIANIYYFKSKLYQFDNTLLNELLKLISLDLKMGQADRHGHNLMFQKNIETKQISLAPIYDYSSSYIPLDLPFAYYKNVYLYLRNNELSIKKLIKKYPKIIEYFDILKEISMEEILSAIENEKKIEFTQEEKEYRIKRDKEYTKLLKII